MSDWDIRETNVATWNSSEDSEYLNDYEILNTIGSGNLKPV